MALSANVVIEVRAGGSDTNGGGWIPGSSGVDLTQQTAPAYSVTDGVTAGTTTITSLTANFGTDCPGNWAYVQGGTGSVAADWYQIISRTNSTTIVVDRSTGLTAGTGVTVKIGGAYATIQRALSNHTTGGIVWVKEEGTTFTITTALSWTNGNTLPNGTPSYLLGYKTTRGDDPTGTNRPLISSSSAIAELLGMGSGPRICANFRFDGGDAVTDGVVMGKGGNVRGSLLINCKIERCTRYGIDAENVGMGGVIACEVTDLKAGATAGILNGILSGCYVHDSPGAGYLYPISGVYCVADTMTGDGFRVGTLENSTFLSHCIAYANGGDGIEAADTYSSVAAIQNCISYGNTGYQLRTDKTERVARSWAIDYNGLGTGGSGARQNYVAGPHDVTLTADPFTDAPNGDFSLNNTSGGGAALKAVGFPPNFPL